MGRTAESTVGAQGREGSLELPCFPFLRSLTRVYFAPPVLGCSRSWGISSDQHKPAPAFLECVA